MAAFVRQLQLRHAYRGRACMVTGRGACILGCTAVHNVLRVQLCSFVGVGNGCFYDVQQYSYIGDFLCFPFRASRLFWLYFIKVFGGGGGEYGWS